MTHTPGPWEPFAGMPNAIVASSGAEPVVVAMVMDDTTVHWEGNRRLIAAAPDLLAALKEAVECYPFEGAWEEVDDGINRWKRCKDAIERTRGRIRCEVCNGDTWVPNDPTVVKDEYDPGNGIIKRDTHDCPRCDDGWIAKGKS